MYKDRDEAARLLALRLLRYRGQSPLILAIPRGGVPMGAVLAQQLGGELDVVLVHKLCAPLQPELAIGAIDESGHASLAPHAASAGATPAWITAEKTGRHRCCSSEVACTGPCVRLYLYAGGW